MLALLAAEVSPSPKPCKGAPVYRSQYADRRLGFSIRVPEDKVGCGPVVGGEGHGVSITLAEAPRASMWATAMPTDGRSIDAILAEFLENWESDAKPTKKTVSSAVLGEIPAKQLVVHWISTESYPARVDRCIVATANVGGVETAFVIGFIAPEAKVRGYSSIFDAFVASWRRLE